MRPGGRVQYSDNRVQGIRSGTGIPIFHTLARRSSGGPASGIPTQARASLRQSDLKIDGHTQDIG